MWFYNTKYKENIPQIDTYSMILSKYTSSWKQDLDECIFRIWYISSYILCILYYYNFIVPYLKFIPQISSHLWSRCCLPWKQRHGRRRLKKQFTRNGANPEEHRKLWNLRGEVHLSNVCIFKKYIPSRELTYPPKMAFWRWFSFSQGGIC